MGIALVGSVTAAGLAIGHATNIGVGIANIWTALILLLTVGVILRRVLTMGTVSLQSIFGAVSAYMIIGLMFASVYAAMSQLESAPFFATGSPADTRTFQYFSFTTLTTLGYGDFTAGTNGGRAVAVMEALGGQIFLATLVARLVASYRAPRRNGEAQPASAGQQRASQHLARPAPGRPGPAGEWQPPPRQRATAAGETPATGQVAKRAAALRRPRRGAARSVAVVPDLATMRRAARIVCRCSNSAVRTGLGWDFDA